MAYSPESPLPQTQEGLLQAILVTLNAMVPLIPVQDLANRRLRLTRMADSVPNLGIGATTANTPRVVAADDTFLGADNTISQVAVDMNAAGLAEIYDNIKVS